MAEANFMQRSPKSRLLAFAFTLLLLQGFSLLWGKTESRSGLGEPPPLKLMEGDVINVTFPGAVELNTQQKIRRDGKISLPLIGEHVAISKTPVELEAELMKLYEPQLVSKEVTVTVVESSYQVSVSGAVLNPGPINPNQRITVLEAIMEAGGFDPNTANLNKVKVTRIVNGRYTHYVLNIRKVLSGKASEPFYLEHRDIVEVPLKVSWF